MIKNYSLVQLVSQLIDGDQGALNGLINLYGGKIHAYCMKFTKSRECSQELVQDVFVKLWTYRSSINKEQSFEAYLFTIAKHICFDHLKKIAREETLKKDFIESKSGMPQSNSGPVNYEHYEKMADQALFGLPPKRKIIYQLRVEEGLTYEEIATKLGISKNTVKEQLAQASKSIKEFFRIHADIA